MSVIDFFQIYQVSYLPCLGVEINIYLKVLYRLLNFDS